jgi:hypothetical protein
MRNVAYRTLNVLGVAANYMGNHYLYNPGNESPLGFGIAKVIDVACNFGARKLLKQQLQENTWLGSTKEHKFSNTASKGVSILGPTNIAAQPIAQQADGLSFLMLLNTAEILGQAYMAIRGLPKPPEAQQPTGQQPMAQQPPVRQIPHRIP